MQSVKKTEDELQIRLQRTISIKIRKETGVRNNLRALCVWSLYWYTRFLE